MLKHSPTKAQPCSEQSWTALWEPWKPHSCCSSRLLSVRVVHPHDSTPTASFDARLVDLLRPRPMRSCSLVQASTQMPTSLVVAAYERRCVRSTLERERRAAGHQCAAREPPGPESGRGTTEHAQESTLADRRPQSGRQERAGGDAQKGLHRGRRTKSFPKGSLGTIQHQICLVRPFLSQAIFFWVLWAP